jgi:DNA-binding GntR family transcriptional regulator
VTATGPATTAQHALGRVRLAIVTGELRPGERVNQEDVAAGLGVSVAPLREALATLEREGQVTYLPRRGYFVTELDLGDLEEIYALRAALEGPLARDAVHALDEEAVRRVTSAARDCVDAAEQADVAAELEANRRFHFGILEAAGRPHAMRLVRLLWDSTEAYRALYYNSPDERRESIAAHDRVLAAIADRDAERLVAELDDHRDRALTVLRGILA